MNSLPTGTVTFLFTDIEGSTKLAREYPDAWESMHDRHNSILRDAVESHHGFVFETLGDSFYAAFHKPGEALQAALKAQRNLQKESWSHTAVRVRMGIHTGEAETDDRDYRGYLTLSLVQRLMSAGHGGQILLSGATENLLQSQLPDDVTLRNLGEHKLKDTPLPVSIFQAVVPDMQSEFPALRCLAVFPTNLPAHLSSFIGREKEMTEIKGMIQDHRLVTLTGSGGTGKTRLALQVAADLLARFRHGVWLVELAPLADPDLIPQTILSVLGVKEQQGRTHLEVLAEYLREKQALIVLDNCEHLVSVSAQVTDTLLRSAPKLKVLASSREALGVKGEQSYPVPSLTMPDIKHLPVIEHLSQYEAVRLFIDRAQLVNPHFVLDDENASFIAQVCHRLDGIPLAIELAAARIKMMSVEQISARLDDRFRLLTGGVHTVLPRQQTLRALIDWSYDILSENERLLFRRLSIFAGGWTLESAEEVCAGDGIDKYDVLDLLSQLFNKSLLLVVNHTKSGVPRYRMLETIRQYAREKLFESGVSEGIRDKHLFYFVKLVEKAEPELYQGNQVFWFNTLNDELDNLRTALEWALATDAEAGLRIASTPYRFWDGYGYLKEMGRWLEKFLNHYKKTDDLYVQALIVSSFGFFRQGNFPEAIRVVEQSVQMARTLSDQQLEAFGLSVLGAFTQLQGNVEEGTPFLERGLALYRAAGNKIGQANALEWLTYDHTSMERAIAFARESLGLHRELNNLTGIAASLVVLARLTLWNGDFSSSVSWLEEALSINQQLDDREGELGALTTSGMLAYWQGDYPRAITYFEEALAISEKIGDQFSNSWIHVRMAYVFLRQGDFQHANELFVASIKRTHKVNFTIALVYAIEGIASLIINQGQPECAARLYAWADATREKIGDYRPPVEQNSVKGDLSVIRSILDDAEFIRFLEAGRMMTEEQAIQMALDS